MGKEFFSIWLLIFVILSPTQILAIQKFQIRTSNPDRTMDLVPIEYPIAEPGSYEENVTEFSLGKIPVIFFDRGKEEAIVVGEGFPGRKEWGIRKAQLFHNYDVILFDYSWHNMRDFLLRYSTIRHPFDAFFFNEKETVLAVTNYLKQYKNYREIIGLCECYSNFTFVLAQAEAEVDEKPFTKLILDSCWHNSRDWLESISFDPWLPCNPQHGGAPKWLQSILRNSCLHWSIAKLLDCLTPNISIAPPLKKIDNPVLFIHGRNDKFVPIDSVFEKIWDATETEKTLFITPFEHSDNRQNPGFYKSICDRFILSQNS